MKADNCGGNDYWNSANSFIFLYYSIAIFFDTRNERLNLLLIKIFFFLNFKWFSNFEKKSHPIALDARDYVYFFFMG